MNALVSLPIAFVFPGQGSQFPGMGRELDRCGPVAGELVSMAEEVTGLPVFELMTRASAATIADPEIAQVLVFVWSVAVCHTLRGRGFHPQVVAGHSVGEYAALTACGSLDVETALALVSFRGKQMAEAALRSPGTMAAIVGIEHGTVEKLCAGAGAAHEIAVVANVNSPRQVVVSGTPTAVDAVVDRAKAAGAIRARRLAVGGAYHSPLMDGAGAAMAERLADVRLGTPRVPLVSSTTGELVTDIQAYREVLTRQLTSPVRWRAVVGALTGLGARTFVEVGPGRVLSGLGREMVRSGHHLTAQDALRIAATNQPTDARPAENKRSPDRPDPAAPYAGERT